MKPNNNPNKKHHPVQEDWRDVVDFGKEVGSGIVDIGRGAVDIATAAGKDFVDPESYKRDWEAIKRGAKFAKKDPIGAAKYSAQSADDFARAMANQATFGATDYVQAATNKLFGSDQDRKTWEKNRPKEPWTGSLEQYKAVQDMYSGDAETRSPTATELGDFAGVTASLPFAAGARTGLNLSAKGTKRLSKGKKMAADISAATVGGVAAEKGTSRAVRQFDPDNPYIQQPYVSDSVPIPESLTQKTIDKFIESIELILSEDDSVNEAKKLYTREEIEQIAQETAKKYNVPFSLVKVLMRQESGKSVDPTITSSAGAIGPMQLMPGTAKGLGVNPYDVNQNIDGGIRYLKSQIDKYKGNLHHVLSAYNAGPGATDAWLSGKSYIGGNGKLQNTKNLVIPTGAPFAQTVDYQNKIIGNLRANKEAWDELTDMARERGGQVVAKITDKIVPQAKAGELPAVAGKKDTKITPTIDKDTKPGYYTVGDSHGVGIAKNSPGEWRNLSKTGASAFSKEHLENINKIPKGSVVVISMGANDIGGNIPKIVDQVNSTVAAAKARGLKVVYVLPTATTNPANQQRREELRQALLKGLSSRDIVDLGIAPSKDQKGDDLHLKSKGYATIGTNIASMLTPGNAATDKSTSAKKYEPWEVGFVDRNRDQTRDQWLKDFDSKQAELEKEAQARRDKLQADQKLLDKQAAEKSGKGSTEKSQQPPSGTGLAGSEKAKNLKAEPQSEKPPEVDAKEAEAKRRKEAAKRRKEAEAKRRKQDTATKNAGVIDAGNKVQSAQKAKVTSVDEPPESYFQKKEFQPITTGDTSSTGKSASDLEQELERARYGGSIKGKAYDPEIHKIDINKVLQRSYTPPVTLINKEKEIAFPPADVSDVSGMTKSRDIDEPKSLHDKTIEFLTGKEVITPQQRNRTQVPESIDHSIKQVKESINTELQEILRLAGRQGK
jgi:hypothetical protein